MSYHFKFSLRPLTSNSSPAWIDCHVSHSPILRASAPCMLVIGRHTTNIRARKFDSGILHNFFDYQPHKTRSKHVFSSWDGPVIKVADPLFNLEAIPITTVVATLQPHPQSPTLTITTKFHTVQFDVETAPHTSSGYVGLVKETWKRQHTLDELVGPKYCFQHSYVPHSTPTPIIDQCGHVISVLAGHPDNPNWEALHLDTANTLERLCPECKLSDEQRKHQRGCNLAFLRLASFASSAFAMWAPRTFAYYAQHLRDLLMHDMTLIINWVNSVFATMTFNFGPRTLCFRHTNSGNLPFGWCTITVLGCFNPCLGGHLALWDLKLIIDFPPGSMILIPSAILWHSNTAISKGERRYSFTQYSSGGIFRWVNYGFQSSEEYWGGLVGEDLVQAQKEQSERWKMGLGLFSTLDELRL
ncbi:uncharacterized protein ARMOST_15511 [Armillaria ostoyae]|uniref:Uncharacterized protein n=1 Tax=Armillaria ostoyae TaxID=47428 RepID=A0A284RTN4_ARMOS|nr:uncharacterized protein ARMOST_15511 [Armillaria ostoyae]